MTEDQRTVGNGGGAGMEGRGGPLQQLRTGQGREGKGEESLSTRNPGLVSKRDVKRLKHFKHKTVNINENRQQVSNSFLKKTKLQGL